MYSCIFYSDNGDVFTFGKEGGNVFDIDGLSGISVDIGTSQGSSQIGETVETLNVNGKTLTVKGEIFSDIENTKRRLRHVLAPFTGGMLVFEEDYYIYVYVKDSPTFSPIKGNGTYTMQFFAPYPFFRLINETNYIIGGITPTFSFPVNYETAHQYGVKDQRKYVSIENDGDLPVPYRLEITVDSDVTYIDIANMQTNKHLRFEENILAGSKITVYRDNNSVLKATLTYQGEEQDFLYAITESSTFFELPVGDYYISALDSNEGNNISVSITYNVAVGGVYED